MNPAQKAEAYFEALAKKNREEAHRYTHLTWQENHAPDDIPDAPFPLDGGFEYRLAEDPDGARVDVQVRQGDRVVATCSLIRESAPQSPSPVEGEWGVDPNTIQPAGEGVA